MNQVSKASLSEGCRAPAFSPGEVKEVFLEEGTPRLRAQGRTGVARQRASQSDRHTSQGLVVQVCLEKREVLPFSGPSIRRGWRGTWVQFITGLAF